jgi:hypothetical protein
MDPLVPAVIPPSTKKLPHSVKKKLWPFVQSMCSRLTVSQALNNLTLPVVTAWSSPERNVAGFWLFGFRFRRHLIVRDRRCI